MSSRRGRDPTKNNVVSTYVDQDRIGRYKSRSALHLLDQFIANYTHDRVPLELVEARNAIRRALNSENPEDVLHNWTNHPIKIVRDAASDEINILNGIPPNSNMDSYTYKWGTITDTRIASMLMGPEERFESRVERFEVSDHNLDRKPGRLAGSVHDSYSGYKHHLQARLNDRDAVATRANIEKAQKPEKYPLNIPIGDDK